MRKKIIKISVLGSMLLIFVIVFFIALNSIIEPSFDTIGNKTSDIIIKPSENIEVIDEIEINISQNRK